MSPIEIRLDPRLMESLLETISPTLELLDNELASAAPLPEDDELLEDFWKSDLLRSQREELTVVARLFDEEFMSTGRAVIAPEDMDKVIRACSAIRLKLRESKLKALGDEQLERGELDDVEWTEDLQISYAAYSLFASLQELIVSEISDPEGFEEQYGDELGDDDSDRDAR